MFQPAKFNFIYFFAQLVGLPKELRKYLATEMWKMCSLAQTHENHSQLAIEINETGNLFLTQLEFVFGRFNSATQTKQKREKKVFANETRNNRN